MIEVLPQHAYRHMKHDYGSMLCMYAGVAEYLQQ